MIRRCTLLLLTTLSFMSSATNEIMDTHFYTPPQQDLVYLQTNTGEVVLMLSDAVAPLHKKRFTALVKSGFYDGKNFYRVIEGFVAQGGSNQEQQDLALAAPLEGEFVSKQMISDFTLVEANATYAPQTGFVKGMPAGIAPDTQELWLLHCPGTLAFARNNDKHSATTEFYIVIGQAPRHLDKNMSVIGRVLTGMEHLQRLPRGERKKGGVIADPGPASRILSTAMGDTMSASETRTFRVQRASHPDYQRKLILSRTLDNPFYHDTSLTPRTIDVCYYQTEVQEITPKPK